MFRISHDTGLGRREEGATGAAGTEARWAQLLTKGGHFGLSSGGRPHRAPGELTGTRWEESLHCPRKEQMCGVRWLPDKGTQAAVPRLDMASGVMCCLPGAAGQAARGASASLSPTTCCPRLLIHAGGPACQKEPEMERLRKETTDLGAGGGSFSVSI